MAHSATYNFDVYQSRNPKASAYYKCVENHFEELERAWDYMYASHLDYWRTYVMTVIYKYLDCGDLHTGFASIAVQTYGDFLNFNPHLHAIVSDECFITNGSFSVAPKFMVTD